MLAKTKASLDNGRGLLTSKEEEKILFLDSSNGKVVSEIDLPIFIMDCFLSDEAISALILEEKGFQYL